MLGLEFRRDGRSLDYLREGTVCEKALSHCLSVVSLGHVLLFCYTLTLRN